MPSEVRSESRTSRSPVLQALISSFGKHSRKWVLSFFRVAFSKVLPGSFLSNAKALPHFAAGLFDMIEP
jgi:hypothetical protein